MSIAIDLILICIVVTFVSNGVHRGFIRTGIRFIGGVISAALSSALGSPAASWIYDKFFRDAFLQKVESGMLSPGAENMAESAVEILQSLPGFIQRALASGGITEETVRSMLERGSGEAAGLVADALSPVFVDFLRVLCVIFVFTICMFLVRLIGDVVSAAFQIPGLSQLNKILGGLFGLLSAVFFLCIAVAALKVFVPMLTDEMQLDFETLLSETRLAGLIYKWDPLGSLFK